MNITPLHDRVVVKSLAAESRSAGGIVIPDNAQEKPNTGEVVAVGLGRITQNGQTVDLTVKVGDHVIYGKHSGHAVKINGEELTVLKEDEIFAIVN